MSSESQIIRPLIWSDGRVRFLDQTALPSDERYVETDDESVVADAIKRLAIRGAPLIGIAAAYGVVLAMNKVTEDSPVQRTSRFERAYNLLATTRPTAVNLFWALDRMRRAFVSVKGEPLAVLKQNLLAESLAIHHQDELMCQQIGDFGAELLQNAAVVLTHCNTGRLATGGKGTALGVIETAWEQKKLKHVYIDETRPLLQGARLTAWELSKLGIPATLIVDSAAGFVMKRGLVNAVIVGADRVASNGDVANKVGTYALAVNARHHGIPFYVAAPTSTIDMSTPAGKDIPIEQRDAREITSFFDNTIISGNVEVYSPAFDITPNDLISAIITESGVLQKPFSVSLRMAVEGKRKEAIVGALS